MIEPLAQKRLRRATLKHRRQEIERYLTASGLMSDPRRFGRRPNSPASEEILRHRLGRALEGLGPVFASFGLYLSSRLDLLPVQTCLDLALIAVQVETTPISAVREAISREFACALEDIYPVFEEVPFESRLMFQSHHALLGNGTPVIVKIAHDKWYEHLELDTELLSVLKPIFSGEESKYLSIENAIDDFRHLLHQQADLIQESHALDELAQDAKEFELLRVPEVFKDLCSPRISTIEQLPGLTVEESCERLNKKIMRKYDMGNAASEEMWCDPNDLARRICLAWLRQVLLGSWFPIDLHPRHIVVLPDKRIAFTGGEFARLPSDTKKNLWQYLIATVTEDPDKACSCLLREMSKGRRPFDADELRHRFRGVVPFRDGVWSHNGDGHGLAEHLFVHWKLVCERNLQPQRYLLAFYRGFFQTAVNAQRLAPDSDPLLAGLQEVRTIEMLTQVRDMLGLAQIRDNLDKYSAMTMGLPQRLDEVLTLVAESSARVKLQSRGGARHRRQQNSSAVVIALLLVLGAVVLLSHQVSVSVVSRAGFDQLSAMVFVAVGALLLWANSRGR